MRYDVSSVRHDTPRVVATAVDREDANHWWVRCEETGCRNVITVGRVHWEPVEPFNPATTYVEVYVTAPPARRCGLHPPARS